MDGGALWATVHEVAESDTTERLHFTSLQPHINQELRLKINAFYLIQYIKRVIVSTYDQENP